MSGITELVEKWESDADTMEQYSDARGAAVCRLHIAELKEAVRIEQGRLLTLAEAAHESGYSEDHLRHEVASGRIQNEGKKGAPRIRRGNLPLKRSKRAKSGPSPALAAAEILGSLSE